MKMRVYAVLDKAVEAYLPPLCFRSEGEAKRSFVDALAASESHMSKHRSDYSFCFLGFYDDNLASFETTTPVVVLEGATALATEDRSR